MDYPHLLAPLALAAICLAASAACGSELRLDLPGLPAIKLALDLGSDDTPWTCASKTETGAEFVTSEHSFEVTSSAKGLLRVVRIKLVRKDGGKLSVGSYSAAVALAKADHHAVMVPNTRQIGGQLVYYHEHRKWREGVTLYHCLVPQRFEEHAHVNNEAPVIVLTGRTGLASFLIGWAKANVAAYLRGEEVGNDYVLNLERREDIPFTLDALEDALIVCTASKPWMDVERAYAREFDAYSGRKHSKPPAWTTDPVFCTWYCYDEKVDQDKMLKVGQKCKELGIRTLLIDAGWDLKPGSWWGDLENGGIGDYQASAELFPDMRGMVDKLHRMGLKVELWAAPFWQSKGSRSYQERTKDWMVWTDKGEDVYLCPRYPGTRDMLRDRFAWIAKTYGVDGMWLDAADGVPPECLAKHEHLDQTMGEAYVDCLSAVRDGLRSVKPDAITEARILHANLNTKSALDVVQPGDAPKSYEMIRLACIHLRPWAHDIVVKNDPMIWPKKAHRATVGKFMATMVCNGVPAISVDLLTESEQNMAIIKAWLDFYRGHKATLLRGEFRLFGENYGIPDMTLAGRDEAVVYLKNPKTRSVDLPKPIRTVLLLNCTSSDTVNLRLSPVSGRWAFQAYHPDWSEAGVPAELRTDGELSLSHYVPQGGAAVLTSR